MYAAIGQLSLVTLCGLSRFTVVVVFASPVKITTITIVIAVEAILDDGNEVMHTVAHKAGENRDV